MKKQLFIGLVLALSINSATQAETARPPVLGQETKGEPAPQEELSNVDPAPEAKTESTQSAPTDTAQKKSSGAFGTTNVKESRRENGQVYRIELQHSSGRNQYIEETDSDGNIESDSSDIEDTPNLPKWRLGSW
ncbi:DUF2782 domain-containing protein [Arenicella xantha]|uniref:Uncharacterized protein DUF2782 n=1 Tax=Arenicella xantha TaxID=644221 RepID=A0A395JPI6_9GAMM|nr:DUF2782 domain-containing protein [Arenicella xantha]RBP53407.1 uncharacterized protein DUF2782 [Arenicella xantha]